jgi:hypothetical protein
MCDPVSLGWAGLAMGAASAGAQAVGQQQQAKAQYQAQLQQNEMQRRMQAQAAAAERTRASRQMTGERLQQAQQERIIAQEKREAILKSELALSSTAGDPITAIAKQRDYFSKLGAQNASFDEQLEMIGVGKTLALQEQGLASQQRLIGINQPIMDPMRPRGLGIQDALSVASGGLQGYQMGQQLSGGMGGVSTDINPPKGPVRIGGKWNKTYNWEPVNVT